MKLKQDLRPTWDPPPVAEMLKAKLARSPRTSRQRGKNHIHGHELPEGLAIFKTSFPDMREKPSSPKVLLQLHLIDLVGLFKRVVTVLTLTSIGENAAKAPCAVRSFAGSAIDRIGYGAVPEPLPDAI